MNKFTWLWRLLKPLRNRKDYENALSFIEAHFRSRKGTPQANLVDVLAVLVERYEEREFPIGPVDPIEAIRFRMEQMGWTNRELGRLLGGKNRVSEVLRRKRRLSLAMIRRIHEEMNIPAEILIQAWK
jgi:HTH-type transcriptional regulator/antitoxin HigA